MSLSLVTQMNWTNVNWLLRTHSKVGMTTPTCASKIYLKAIAPWYILPFYYAAIYHKIITLSMHLSFWMYVVSFVFILHASNGTGNNNQPSRSNANPAPSTIRLRPLRCWTELRHINKINTHVTIHVIHVQIDYLWSFDVFMQSSEFSNR